MSKKHRLKRVPLELMNQSENRTEQKRARIEDLKGKEEVGKQKEQSKSGRVPEENNVAVKSTGVKF